MTDDTAAATAAEPVTAADDPGDEPEAELAPIAVVLLTVHPAGALAGRTLRMRYPSVGFLIAQRRGVARDPEWWAEVVDAIEEHDLGREPESLPAAVVNEIGVAWVAAMKERAVPPA